MKEKEIDECDIGNTTLFGT